MNKQIMPIAGGKIELISLSGDDETDIEVSRDTRLSSIIIHLTSAELLALAMLCLERYNEIGEERIIEAKESDNG